MDTRWYPFFYGRVAETPLEFYESIVASNDSLFQLGEDLEQLPSKGWQTQDTEMVML